MARHNRKHKTTQTLRKSQAVVRVLVQNDLPFAIVGVALVESGPIVRVCVRMHRVGTLVDALLILVQVCVGRMVRRMAGMGGVPMRVPVVRMVGKRVRRVRRMGLVALVPYAGRMPVAPCPGNGAAASACTDHDAAATTATGATGASIREAALVVGAWGPAAAAVRWQYSGGFLYLS